MGGNASDVLIICPNRVFVYADIEQLVAAFLECVLDECSGFVKSGQHPASPY